MTLKFAVIGHPIAHSKSPQIHHAFAKQFAINLSYERMEAPLNAFMQTIVQCQTNGYVGCNVSLPFKQQAWRLAKHCDAMAQLSQSVNTLRLTDLSGYNTDGMGLISDLKNYCDLTDAQIVVLGAGGAAYGILPALMTAKPRSIKIFNRTAYKAEQMCQHFLAFAHQHQVLLSVGSLSDSFTQALQNAQVFINASSSSVDKQTFTWQPEFWHARPLVYDLFYAQGGTSLTQHAKQFGCVVTDGLGMLVEQAALSFYLWHGKKPDTQAVLTELRQS